MSITYPLTLPSVKAPSSIVLTVGFTTSVSRSPYTLERQAQEWPGQVWRAEARFPPMVREDAAEWIAFLLRLRGRAGTFLMGDPCGETPRGVATGTPLVDGAGQTGYSLATKGWAPNVTGILKKGDYFGAGTGLTSRMFFMTKDADTDSNGKAVLEFAPDNFTAFADGAALIVNDAKGLFSLDDNNVSYSVEEAQLYGFSFNATGEP